MPGSAGVGLLTIGAEWESPTGRGTLAPVTATPRDAERDMDSPTHSPAVQTALDLPAERRRMLDLSLTQLVGGSAAAATGAALASTLGVAGTVLGAAAVSVTTAVASAAYTQSLRRTGKRVRSTGARPGRTEPDGHVRPPRRRPSITPPKRGAVRVRPVFVAAAAIFAVAILAITGVELLTGRAISGTGRTTVSGVAAEVRGGSHPAAPTTHPGPTPSGVPGAPAGSTESPSTSGTPGGPTAGGPTSTGPAPSSSTSPTTPVPTTPSGPLPSTVPPPNGR